MKLNMVEIERAARDEEPTDHVYGYKVSTYDVTEQTAEEYKDATGEEEFKPDCTHVQYEIFFSDEFGIRRGMVQVGFENNVIDEFSGDIDLMVCAGFAEEE